MYTTMIERKSQYKNGYSLTKKSKYEVKSYIALNISRSINYQVSDLSNRLIKAIEKNMNGDINKDE